MSPSRTPALTGSLYAGETDRVIIHWLNDTATGDEYGGPFVSNKMRLADLWGVVVRHAEVAMPPAVDVVEESLQSRAAAMARSVPAVETERPAVPQLTGNLLDDVRRVTGLTYEQIARATRVSGRAVAAWSAGTVPHHREPFLQALRSIGLSLVGGLGQSGVQRWLLAGTPSRLDRLAAGDLGGVASEARAYETSPAT